MHGVRVRVAIRFSIAGFSSWSSVTSLRGTNGGSVERLCFFEEHVCTMSNSLLACNSDGADLGPLFFSGLSILNLNNRTKLAGLIKVSV